MYMARPGIEPRTPDLQVRCPTDCASTSCRQDKNGRKTWEVYPFIFNLLSSVIVIWWHKALDKWEYLVIIRDNFH